MKKFLLPLAAVAFASMAHAQEFNASDWVLNAQTFNKVNGEAVSTVTPSDDNKILTATVPATAASTLSRFELSSNADITMGAGENVVVMKVEYVNCCFQDFDGNVISILRQLYDGDSNADPQNTPFFVTDQNKMAGRISQPQNTATATTAYYWRDMAGITNSSGSCDWENAFTIYGRRFTNGKFTVDGDNMYGRCWLGIRFAHSNKNTNVIGDDATVKISYIGVTSLDKLGAATSADLKGTQVKNYIEGLLDGSSAIDGISNDRTVTIRVAERTIEASEADRLEIYNLSGAKIADTTAGTVTVSPGFYIAKAHTGDATPVVRKLAVK